MINPERLDHYCEINSTKEPSELALIRRKTHLHATQPHMLSGPVQGRLLYNLVAITNPANVLEIGTFTGYATAWMAKGLQKGTVHTIEIDPERYIFAKELLEDTPWIDRIKMYQGDGVYVINSMDIEFDIVFIDASKKENEVFFEMILPKLRSGGLILLDNVLWKGKVLDIDKDKRTQMIYDFNAKLASDPRIETLLLPLRDGLTMIRKC